MQSVSPQPLEELKTFGTPSVCNAIETFKVRSRSEGFTDGSIRCQFPDLGRMVGHAATATIRTAERGDRRPAEELWRHVLAIPEPRIIVVQDLDEPAGVGSFWGEVHANLFKALGCLGAITNGSARDLDEVRGTSFHLFAGSVVVSHAYAHIVDVGCQVTVGGLRVEPGDLLHADRHGVVQVPFEIVDRLPEAVRQIEAGEREVIALCRAADFTPEKLFAYAKRE